MAVVKVPLSFPDKYPVSIFLSKSGVPHSMEGSVVLVLKAASRPLSAELAFLEILVDGAHTVSGAFDLGTEELDLLLPTSGLSQLTLDLSVLSSGVEVSSLSVPASVSRRYYVSGSPGPTSSLRTLASEEEAQEGADNTHWMSPLRTKQAFDSMIDISGIELM
jgi:hypothetical protein